MKQKELRIKNTYLYTQAINAYTSFYLQKLSFAKSKAIREEKSYPHLRNSPSGGTRVEHASGHQV